MNILKVSCKQFAAFQDFSAEFKPGVNIIFGQNESGKSSLVNLLIEIDDELEDQVLDVENYFVLEDEED